MNFSNVEFLVGRVLMVSGSFMLLPVVLSLFFFSSDVLELLYSAAISLIIGYSMTIHGKNETTLTNREAILTVCASWLMVSLCGALPFVLAGVLDPFYAILESASGFTTLGESLITNLTDVPKSILLWRNITQWLGGMGVIVLFVSFLPHYGSGASNLFNAELSGPSKEKILPRISDSASLLWIIYVGITIFFAFLMFLCGMNAFESIAHSFATVSLGGFPVYNDSLQHYNSAVIELLTSFFNILASGSFYLYFLIYIRGWRMIFKDTEFRIYLLILFSFTCAVTTNLWLQGNYSFAYSLYNGFFHVTQATTTSGYAIASMANWPPFCHAALIILIFVGGCSGSASGGLKISRLIILLKLGWLELKKILHPKMVAQVTMGHKIITPTIAASVVRYFFLYMLVYFIAVILISLTGLDLYSSSLIILSTLSTAGTAIPNAILGGSYSYANISDFGKILMTICMFLGRLELVTVLVLLRPEFWRETRNW